MSKPTIKFLTSPEIIFDGADAYCQIEIDIGGDYTIDFSVSTIEAYDGAGWVHAPTLTSQIGDGTKRATICWKMQAATKYAQLNAWIVNSNGEESGWAITEMHSYPPEGVDPTILAIGVVSIAVVAIMIENIT
jgi:hypothetical protein